MTALTNRSLLATPNLTTRARAHNRPFGTLNLPPLHPNCRLIVTIPAKDEADFIEHTLTAVTNQTTPAGIPIDPTSYEVIILANNCSDNTAGVVRSFACQPTLHQRQQRTPPALSREPRPTIHVAERTLPPPIACVGTARRLMMDTALDRFIEAGNPHGMICTTDADTLVHREWVYWTLQSAAEGARAVGGRILVPDADRSAAGPYRKDHLLDVTYRSLQYCLESMMDPDPADPWPRHFQHFGPSTAVRVDAYLACGGIPPLKCLEDVGLVNALERVDIPVTHNRNVKVYTSSRISHRVDGRGFSEQLNEWADLRQGGGTQFVPGLENCRWLFKFKVALRRAFHRGTPAKGDWTLLRLAAELRISYAELREFIDKASSFGSLYQDVRERLLASASFSDEPIELAVQQLRRFTASLRNQARRATATIKTVGTHPTGTAPAAQRVAG